MINGKHGWMLMEDWIEENWNLEDWNDRIETYRTEMKSCETERVNFVF